jgi:hypothetical protein
MKRLRRLKGLSERAKILVAGATVAVAILATAIVVLASGGSSGTPESEHKGFYNMKELGNDLANSIEANIMKSWTEEGRQTVTPTINVSEISCVSTGKQTARCLIEYSGSGDETLKRVREVNISPDGKTYQSQRASANNAE